MITADRGFIQSLGSDFLGFFFAGNFIFSRLCAGCPAVEIKGPLEPAHSCNGQFLLCLLLLVI